METISRYKPVRGTQRKGVDYTTHSMDMDMISYLDLKSMVYEMKRIDPSFTQRKAIGRCIELLKLELEKVGIILDHSKVIQDVREHGASIRSGIAAKKNPSPSTTDNIQPLFAEVERKAERSKTISWILGK